MMKSLPKKLIEKMTTREQQNSLRALPEAVSGIDFSSNDYLGFSISEQLKERINRKLAASKFTNGATGSRLLTGNHTLYNEAEVVISNFHKSETALIFNSGYDANIGFFSCVPQKGDIILYDAYIHASIRDGISMSLAKSWKFKHNNIQDLERKIKRSYNSNTSIYVVTESVFSMDGDSPPLKEIIDCCEQYNCLLVVDEAHALGVIGNEGKGLLGAWSLQDKVFASIVTFGKALGGHGAAILGAEELKQYLVNFARSLIYTTGLPPHSVAGIIAGYQLLEQHTLPLKILQEHIVYFKEQVKKYHLEAYFIASDSAIHCALIPGVNNVKEIANQLVMHGYNVKPILPPTIPAGGERLRFCLHSYNSKEEIASVLQLMATFVTHKFKNG
ncbi:aminotransferase class I/II-fold pyridoxal phosphate-dependent enzyme [Ascidiimonas sp. W6]|uniref:aminotransferase class I/II-fold pyridoxal phosphate-dependent enzyme n=1 Tax=Ascidiimonas meishanensis TaxID=3128903 RepID=UPI0030EC7176